MYNIYTAEKRQKELDNQEKIRKNFAKYRKKFKSKRLFIIIIINPYKNIINFRTNTNYV